jgi:hypothetical protein
MAGLMHRAGRLSCMAWGAAQLNHEEHFGPQSQRRSI